MQPIETMRQGNKVAKLYFDECPLNPRTEFDNLATIYYVSNRYLLGDKRTDEAEIDAITRDPNILWLPVQCYIHGGITMTAANRNPYPDPAWDSGQSGIVAISKDTLREEYHVKHVSPRIRRQAYEIMRNEVDEFAAYLEGDVYGVVVEQLANEDDDEGEETDSCWGFYGLDDARAEARLMLAG